MSRPPAASGPMQNFRLLPGHLIRRLHQVSVALFAEECGKLNLTPVQYAVLFSLGENDGLDATRLSELVFFDRSTLGAVLDRLEVKALIRREPSATDRRVKLLQLTPKGRRLLAKAVPAIIRVQDRLLEPFAPKKRQDFVRLLKELSDLHHEVPTAVSSRDL